MSICISLQVTTAQMALKEGMARLTDGERLISEQEVNELTEQYIGKLRSHMLSLEEKCHAAKKVVTYKRYTPPYSFEEFDSLVEDLSLHSHACILVTSG